MAVDAIGIWCTILLGIAQMADSVSSFVFVVPSTAKACTVCDSYETFRISRRGSEWFRQFVPRHNQRYPPRHGPVRQGVGRSRSDGKLSHTQAVSTQFVSNFVVRNIVVRRPRPSVFP